MVWFRDYRRISNSVFALLVILMFTCIGLLFTGCGANIQTPPQLVTTIAPTGDFQLHSPEGISATIDGKLLVADTWNNRILRFDPAAQGDPQPEVLLNAHGTEPGQFSVPADVACDGSGNLYITDSWNHRVQKFSPDGKLLAHWGRKSDIWNLQPDELFYPRGIALDLQGAVYVADSADHRVMKYNSDGEVIFNIGDGQARKQPGFFNTPLDVATDSEANLYVTDSRNNRVQKFNPQGKVIDRWGENKGEKPGEFNRPSGIAVDSQNRIYVVDSRNHRVQVFNSSGGLITVFGKRGSGPGEFESPESITIDRNDKIYVLDWGNNRIQVFSF